MTCESCIFYAYDESTDSRYCSVNLDEDEMEGFLRGSNFSCPYYRLDDEYEIVKHQN